MAEIFKFSSIIPGKAKSGLTEEMKKGSYPTSDGVIGVTLKELFGLAICETAAWPDHVEKVRTILPAEATAFEYAPARWVLMGNDEKMSRKLAREVGEFGSVVDLSHGRSVIRLSGDKAIWVLSKLFAIHFPIMTEKSGLATSHHGITAQIWREDNDTFDIIIFRSFAASFWRTLTSACADVGYEVT